MSASSVNQLRNRLYYAIKPWLPAGARWALRRWYCGRQRARLGQSWPILPGSEKPPPKWRGWPEGKQFAVIITHDVEGPLGLSRCRQLMKLDLELGFRSSFNLIPEGPYNVPDDLRSEFQRRGIEIAVHDLHHCGKLYNSRSKFERSAVRINHYLKEWGAVGFRSGFMFHNLDWAHSLNILYEASTFDTDPFEPQPEGVGTIFPFWVAPPKLRRGGLKSSVSPESDGGRDLQRPVAGQGYVELPYTLVQDSTLFSLLGEREPDIWFQKVDWLARSGGMVLVNVHPDYSAFNGGMSSNWEYPVELYSRLLKYIRSKYEGAYWHVTAGELAKWYKSTWETTPEQSGPNDKRGEVQTDSTDKSRSIRREQGLARLVCNPLQANAGRHYFVEPQFGRLGQSTQFFVER